MKTVGERENWVGGIQIYSPLTLTYGGIGPNKRNGFDIGMVANEVDCFVRSVNDVDHTIRGTSFP